MKKLKFYFAGLAIAGLTLFACNKDDDNGSESFDDSELLKTSAVMDRINEEDFQVGMETANDENALAARTSSLAETSSVSCATVTQTSVGLDFPMTFSVDFGTGCTHNGITRSGSLTITFTGFFLTNGSQMIIERNNYVVNGYHVAGTVTYVNQTTDPDTPQWSRTVTNGQVTTPAGEVYTHTNTRIVKQIQGVGTPFNLLDNVYEVTSGTAIVTGPNNNTLTATITTPLIKAASCTYISQGVLNLQGAILDGDLDYGNGECNNTAVYTHSDGVEYTVILN